MSFNKTSDKNFRISVIKELVTFFLCLLICIGCRISVFSGIRFFLFALLNVTIPGLAVFLLLRPKADHLIDVFLLSDIFGVAVVLLEYVLVMLLRIESFSVVVSLCLCALSVLCIFKNYERIDEYEYDRNTYWLILLYVFLSTICFFYLAYANVNPDIYGGTVYDKDFLFWIGNSISFMKGLPVQNFRLVGETYYYHYFSSVLMAEASFVTGIEVFTISYYFSYLIPCEMLAFASYSFSKGLLKKDLSVFVCVVLILLTDGLTSYLHDHLFYCPFGYDYAYALSMAGFIFLVRMAEEEEYNVQNVFVSCLILILTTGFKGPNGLIVLFAYGVIAFSLLLKKKWKQGFGFGFLWLFCFIATYFLFLTNIRQMSREANGLEFLGLLGSFDTNPFAIKILSKLISFGFPDNGLSRIVSLGLYVLLNNIGAMTSLIFAMISLIPLLKKKRDMTTLLALIGTSLWGILLTIITHQDGNSQMYFIMSALPFCALSGLYALEMLKPNKQTLYSALIILLILSLGDIVRFVRNCIYTNINDAYILRSGGVINEDRRYYFTDEEYELALWLKENTESNDYIALDIFEYDKMRKEVMLGVFSERFIWNDGQYSSESERSRRRKLVVDALKGDTNALQEIKKEKVKYLIQTLSQNPDDLIKGADIVYEKNGYRVYSLD